MAATTMNNKITAFIDEKYIPLDPKLKIGIALAAIILPVALCYFLVFQPNTEKIAALDKQITSLKGEVVKAKKAARDLPKHEKNLADTKKRFLETAAVLPKSQEIPNLLRTISDLGKSAGLDFLSFKPGGETPKDFYAEIPINISTKGPYHNMGYFLDQVSKMERLVTVNNIKMGSPKKEGGEMLLNSSCRLITYRFTNTELPKNKDKKGKRRKR